MGVTHRPPRGVWVRPGDPGEDTRRPRAGFTIVDPRRACDMCKWLAGSRPKVNTARRLLGRRRDPDCCTSGSCRGTISSMTFRWRQVAGWYHAAAIVLLPWLGVWRPQWLPAVLASVWLAARVAARSRMPQPWLGLVQAVSGLTVVALAVGGWIPAAGWAAAAVVVAGTRIAWGTGGARPDAVDGIAAVVWAVPFVLLPALLGEAGAGAVAAAVVLMGAGSAAAAWSGRGPHLDEAPAPPTREVRGTVVLRGVVLGDDAGLPVSIPLELELRAGESVAVLHDSDRQAEAVAAVVAGRRSPVAGEVSIDGAPPAPGERLVAVVGRGEPFVRGDVAANVAALCGSELARGTLEAVHEACSLADVEHAAAGRLIAADGEPLSALHRCLLLAARVVPSDYRVVVVVDPVPWVNAVHAEQWRAAVVRASLGRSAVWLTTDRMLAARADRVLELRHGGLRPPM